MEWENEYDSNKQRQELALTDEEIQSISRSISDQDILDAANGLGEKGVA